MKKLCLQAECLIVVWRPCGLFCFSNLSPFLVSQVRSNKIDLNERLEGLSSRPLEVIGCHNWKKSIWRMEHGVLKTFVVYFDSVWVLPAPNTCSNMLFSCLLHENIKEEKSKKNEAKWGINMFLVMNEWMKFVSSFVLAPKCWWGKPRVISE